MIIIPDDQLDDFISSCCRRLRQNNAEELYAAIGYGGMTIANCLPKLKEEWQKLQELRRKRPERRPAQGGPEPCARYRRRGGGRLR